MKHYRAKLRCEKCRKETCHWYEDRTWRCIVCAEQSKLSEALSDVADAAVRHLRRLEVEEFHVDAN